MAKGKRKKDGHGATPRPSEMRERSPAKLEETVPMFRGQPLGKYIFAVGLLIMFLGYIFLAKEFLTVSPIMILGGLGMIFAGLWNM